MFEGSIESAKEHKPPRVMPQLMQYFKAIKVSVPPPKRWKGAEEVTLRVFFVVVCKLVGKKETALLSCYDRKFR